MFTYGEKFKLQPMLIASSEDRERLNTSKVPTLR